MRRCKPYERQARCITQFRCVFISEADENTSTRYLKPVGETGELVRGAVVVVVVALLLLLLLLLLVVVVLMVVKIVVEGWQQQGQRLRTSSRELRARHQVQPVGDQHGSSDLFLL